MGVKAVRTNRRRRSRWPVLLLVSALLLSACGGGDDDGDGAETGDDDATTADIDTTAMVRMAWDLAGSAGSQDVRLDPAQIGGTADHYVLGLIYGSLLFKNENGEYEPELAESATVVDASTIEVTLREGLEFSDGTPLDAEAVKFSIERNRDSGNRILRPDLQAVESIDVTSPTSLTINLSAPVAGGFYDLLAFGDTAVVSPTAAESGDLSTQPVGAGPFRFVSYEPAQSLVLEKNPTYHAADSVQIAGVEFIQSDFGVTTVNALRGGRVDAAILDQTTAESLQGVDGVEVHLAPSDTLRMWAQICQTQRPFDDVRVRQALNYATDQEALAEAMTGGIGEPRQGFWPVDHPLFNDELEGLYDHDVEQARALLEDAGQADLTFDMIVIPQPESTLFGEIVQQQWAEAGITVNLVTSQDIVQDYLTDRTTPVAAYPAPVAGIDKLTRYYLPDVFANHCDYQDPELDDAVAAVRAAEPGSDDAVQAWADVQEIVWTDALEVFGIFTATAYAWTDRLGEVVLVPEISGRVRPDLRRVVVVTS